MIGDSTLAQLLSVVDTKGKAALSNGQNVLAQDELLDAARRLVASLESPVERLSRMVYLEPTLLAMVRVAIDWKLFEALAAEDGAPKTTAKLAASCNVDNRLMSRSLKHLAAGDIIQEVDTDFYAPTPMSLLLCDAGAQGTVIDMLGLPQIVSQLPYFFKEHGNVNPIDKDNSAFMHSYKTKMHYFQWIAQPGMEERHEAFGKHMSFKDMGKKWYDPSNTDVQKIFDHPTDPTAVLMVDVGGNIGHDLIGFHEQYPQLPGRLILQDLPAQIAQIDPATLPHTIQPMGHDFFIPQPIVGAKAYYLHMVLHDWPNKECVKILDNIKPAMKVGYSKILLNEIIIPDKGANWFGTSVDMLMMMVHAAQERTESDWRSLVQKSGMKITKIWDCGGAPQKILEVELE